jgi:siderophore synthetase component
VFIGLSSAGLRLVEPEFLNWPVFAEDFALPVALTTFEHAEKDTKAELRPSVLFNHLRSALDVDPVEDGLYKEVSDQLTNSAENGRYWIEWYAAREPLSFQSSVIDWEQSLYTGHPLHPVSSITLIVRSEPDW